MVRARDGRAVHTSGGPREHWDIRSESHIKAYCWTILWRQGRNTLAVRVPVNMELRTLACFSYPSAESDWLKILISDGLSSQDMCVGHIMTRGIAHLYDTLVQHP